MSRMSTTSRILLVLVVLVAAAAGTFAVLQKGSSGGSGEPGSDRGGSGSEIWSVGDRWTVKVRQDSASISPDTKTSEALVPYRFEVVSEPKSSSGEWVVRVEQDGAEGPFADGWRLTYVERGDEMVLTRVGAGEQRLIEATVADIVLGSNFPYETSYDAAPKDKTLDSAELAKRASTPPALPKGKLSVTTGGSSEESSGAMPPKDAPVLKAGEVPPGAPVPGP